MTTALRRATGSEVSPGDLLKGVDLELLVGHDALEMRVLVAELLEALGVVGLETAVLVAPPVIGLLGDLEMLGDLGDNLASARSRSASRNFRTTWSGVCFRLFTAR